MTSEEVELILARADKPDFDPALKAIITYVVTVKNITVGEANGFYNSTTITQQLDTATAEFISAMEKTAIQQEG